ncbi:adenine glycosylase [Slackia isoflavoniconvertens]|uniref:adenine glycosylase n=1 Tax=Slackia isoflavoniconvertens TaxID=572010 RepID=UPI003A9832F1
MIIEGALEAPLFSSEPSDADIAEFQAWVREAGQALYRDLPWRNTRDAYAIWISEAMLQQTQVSRVLSRWERFLRHFPTVDALASASSADVVEEWQGLGYNRRALALKRAADICSAEYAGRMPEGVDKLVKLPGIGDATAAGITAFSRDVPCLYLETNVRAVFIHCFFRDAERVTDKELRPLVERACPAEDVRGWYYALLDVGARLKKDHKNPTRRAAAYTRQSKFEGSRRQKRAWLVREVMAAPGLSSAELLRRLNIEERKSGRDGVEGDEFESIMADLAREGFFHHEGDGWLA